MLLYGMVFIVMMLDGLVETIVCLYERWDFYSFQNDLFPEKFLKQIVLAPFNVWNAATLVFFLLELRSSNAPKKVVVTFYCILLIQHLIFEMVITDEWKIMNDFKRWLAAFICQWKNTVCQRKWSLSGLSTCLTNHLQNNNHRQFNETVSIFMMSGCCSKKNEEWGDKTVL